MSVSLGRDFADLQKRLKKATDGRERRLAMNKRIRGIVKPTEDDLRAAVRAVPVKGSRGGGSKARRSFAGSPAAAVKRGGGLRETVARLIQTKITNSGPRQGIRLRLDAAKLPDGQKKLPKRLDGQGRWRHPVFGNRNVWVDQHGRPWWAPVISRHLGRMRSEIGLVIEDVKKELTG